MKAYVAVTTIIFGLISVAHVWRVIVEPYLLGQVWYIVTSLFGVALFIWGLRLLWRRVP